MSSTFGYHAKKGATFEAAVRRHISGSTEWFALNIEAHNSAWVNDHFVNDNADVTFFVNREQLESLWHALSTAYTATMDPDARIVNADCTTHPDVLCSCKVGA